MLHLPTLRSLGDAMPSLARDGSKALAGGLASLGQGIESLNGETGYALSEGTLLLLKALCL